MQYLFPVHLPQHPEILIFKGLLYDLSQEGLVFDIEDFGQKLKVKMQNANVKINRAIGSRQYC